MSLALVFRIGIVFAMHAERDIVMANPFISPYICPMPVLCLNEWTNRHIFDDLIGWGIILVFFEPIQFQGKLLEGKSVKYKTWDFFCKYRPLSRKR